MSSVSKQLVSTDRSTPCPMSRKQCPEAPQPISAPNDNERSCGFQPWPEVWQITLVLHLLIKETMILFSQTSLISSFLKISMEHIVMGIQLWLPITLWNTALIVDNPMGIPLYSQGAQLWFPKTLWIIRCCRFSPVSKTLFTARRKLIETGRKKDIQLVGHTRKSPIMWTPTLYHYMYWKLMLLLFCGIFMFIYFWFCESHESLVQ